MGYKKILIVEDNLIEAKKLQTILTEKKYAFVDIATTVEKATKLFKEINYNLTFINLNNKETTDGIDLVKNLSKKHSFKHIYISHNADEKTVQKAKTTNPAGYIIKPFSTASIYANVEIALNFFNNDSFFTYSHKGMQQQILLSTISYIEADGAYIKIYSSTGNQHFVRKSLSEFRELYSSIFIRVHKSIIVNKDYVQGYTSQFVQVNYEKLPIGRTYKTHFLTQIKNMAFSY